ncbi:MAG: stage II sporulation protein R [Thermoanaerobacteraceae bacterium]|nr:stage II sporulation protein R [Thermoanaerobacteraceae bacterium]
MTYKVKLLKKIFTVTLGILILSMLCAIVGASGLAGGIDKNSKVTANQLSNKLIRLHVIANSDSPEDQQIKLKVRDVIISALNEEFKDIDDINISRKFIKNNLKYIEKIAKQEIEKNGKNYSVKAVIGKFPFPVKNYGYVTLPAGQYEALRIIIGSGKGENWWCVLFPPLCFVDITRGISEDEAKVALSKAFTKQELEAIKTYKSPGEIPIEIRFKVQELWEETKGKIDRAVKLAFK